jgi:hypothetical protein
LLSGTRQSFGRGESVVGNGCRAATGCARGELMRLWSGELAIDRAIAVFSAEFGELWMLRFTWTGPNDVTVRIAVAGGLDVCRRHVLLVSLAVGSSARRRICRGVVSAEESIRR